MAATGKRRSRRKCRGAEVASAPYSLWGRDRTDWRRGMALWRVPHPLTRMRARHASDLSPMGRGGALPCCVLPAQPARRNLIDQWRARRCRLPTSPHRGEVACVACRVRGPRNSWRKRHAIAPPDKWREGWASPAHRRRHCEEGVSLTKQSRNQHSTNTESPRDASSLRSARSSRTRHPACAPGLTGLIRLTPRVDRQRRGRGLARGRRRRARPAPAVASAEDLPEPLRLAAGDDDVDVLRLEQCH